MVAATTLAALVLPTALYAGMLDPGAPPPTSGGTMRTLEELKPAWDQIIPGAPRFVPVLAPDINNVSQAYLDKETGLVWAKSINYTALSWQDALDHCTQLALGGRRGWRLPTIEELTSLVDPNQTSAPFLPNGYPFAPVSVLLWSSSTYSTDSTKAWYLNLTMNQPAQVSFKDRSADVLCVRGG